MSIDWGEDEPIPCQLRTFVDLRHIPKDVCKAVTNDNPQIFALVESTTPVRSKTEIQKSEIFVPYKRDTGPQQTRQYHWATVCSFVEPICVIPDLGNSNPRAVLKVKPRHEWAEDFLLWLKAPHEKLLNINEEEE